MIYTLTKVIHRRKLVLCIPHKNDGTGCTGSSLVPRPHQLTRGVGVLSEEVVQVYGFCIRTLRLPVISVMIIGVMRFSYNKRAVLDGRFRRHLFQAMFIRTTYPSRTCVYFGWSRVHKAVESAVTAPIGM